MFVTYALSLFFTFVAFFSFFAPAYSFDPIVIIDGVEYQNPSLINVATGINIFGQTIPFEKIDLALVLLITTIVGIIASGGCLLFLAFYKKQVGFKIKRMITLATVGFVFNTLNLSIVSSLEAIADSQGQKLGLAFTLYNSLLLISIGILIGLVVKIILTIKEKHNWIRFQEYILVEESRMPYIKDAREKQLALANLKYMKQRNNAPTCTKEMLQAKKEEVLKLMMEHPEICDCNHEHDENCTCESHHNDK